MFSSQVFSVRKALVAAVLTIAAAPFAVSGELPTWLMRSAAAVPAPAGGGTAGGLADEVARAGKSDRAAVVPAGIASQTFSFQPSGVEGMSVLVRIVSRKPARAPNGKPAPRQREKADWPRAACEPVVSLLTEVAKQLAPGRCIT